MSKIGRTPKKNGLPEHLSEILGPVEEENTKLINSLKIAELYNLI